MAKSNSVSNGYARIHGLNMYYEIHGAGEQPLVLIHGGFGLTTMFAEFIPQINAGRTVIAVELQGHGHTADISRAFSYEALADDIAALIAHLGLEQADVMGYSLGGGVALQTAIRHPDKVRKLIVLSAPCKRVGWYPAVLEGMAAVDTTQMLGSPMYAAYAAVAPNPEGFHALGNKTRALLSIAYDWSAAVAALRMPVLIAHADADSIPPAHAAEFFGLLGGGVRDAGWNGEHAPKSWLAILPGTTHYNALMSPYLPLMAQLFLDA